MFLTDSHAHLDYEYDESVESLIANAKAAGIQRILTIAASAESLPKARDLADRFANVYFTAGIHPHDAKDYDANILTQIRTLQEHPKCLGVGELGLDYFYDLSDREIQKQALKEQLQLSWEIGKPIIVHTREADADTVHFLELHAKQFQERFPNKIPGVIHCFTGSAALAQSALSLGYTISFSGIITFKNAEPLREIVRNLVPLERMLVETDSPFLAPIPHRGKKNQPAFTKHVAEKVAELKCVSLEHVAQVTSSNFERLFGIS